jgi:hypothetical protein
MAKQGINTGTSPNDGLGDSLLTGAIKINSNFSEIYSTFGNGNTLSPITGYANTAGIATVSQGLTGTPSINVYNIGVTSAINVGAASTFQKSVHFESTLLIGAADELQLFHSGVDSYIDNSSSGNLIIRDGGTGIQLRRSGGGPSSGLMAAFNNDAGVELYYNNVIKFQTFQNGVAINDSVGIGSTAGNPPYRLTVSGVGATITQGLANAIADFTSSVNGYGQLNVRNSLSGTSASGDVVITTDTGNDTSNFIDLGINNTGFSTSSWTINGALDGYLYTSDGNLSIGAAAANKYLSLFAGGTLASNEQVRVTTTGVGIGTTNPTSKLFLDGAIGFVNSNIRIGSDQTLPSATGSSNIAIGNFAGNPTSSGTRNVFIGDFANAFGLDGSYNVMVGYRGSSQGSHNIHIGEYHAGGSGNYNVVIGNGDGANNYNFGVQDPSKDLQFAIGVNTTSNNPADSKYWLVGNEQFNVGVGTVNATSKLTVNGDTLVTGISTVGLANTSTPPNNSQMSFELTSNTNLRIKVRGTDGVLRSANITLA